MNMNQRKLPTFTSNMSNSQRSTTSTNDSFDTEDLDSSSRLEKGAMEERNHTESKINNNRLNKKSGSVCSSTYWDDYDDLPANAEDRKLWFFDEYVTLLHRIASQNCLIKEFKKTLCQQIHVSRSNKICTQLTSLLRTEIEKVEGMVAKALSIQRRYPNEKWNPIPFPDGFDETKIKMVKTTTTTTAAATTMATSAAATTANPSSPMAASYACGDIQQNLRMSRNTEQRRSSASSSSTDDLHAGGGGGGGSKSKLNVCSKPTIQEIRESKDGTLNSGKGFGKKTYGQEISKSLHNFSKYDERNPTSGTDFTEKFHSIEKELHSRDKLIEGLEEKYSVLTDELRNMKKDQAQIRDSVTSSTSPTWNGTSSGYSSFLDSTANMSISQPISTHALHGNNELDKQQNHHKQNTVISVQEQHHDHEIIRCTDDSQQNNNRNIDNSEQFPDEVVRNQLARLFRVLHLKETEMQDILEVVNNRLDKSATPKPKKSYSPISYPAPNSTSSLIPTIKRYPANSSNIKFLQKKLNSQEQENLHFRQLLQSQQEELEKYHLKYFKAQKQIAGQKNAIENLQGSCKLIENEVRSILSSVKNSYEDKFKEVEKYPRILRAQKKRMEVLEREKREWQDKSISLNKQVKILQERCKNKINAKKATPNASDKLKIVQRELNVFRQFNVALKEERDRLKETIATAKTNYEKLRLDANKVLVRCKERLDIQRQSFEQKVHELEDKVHANQTSASDYIQQKDTAIAKMQVQLITLNENFEVSQEQVHVLRDCINKLRSKHQNI